MVRKAVLNDVPDIYGLVESYAKKGVMLHRSSSEIYDGIRDFFVFLSPSPLSSPPRGEEVRPQEELLCGACALHICSEDMGEIRSLAVKEGSTGKGIGTALVNACLDEARALGLKKVFALTYKTNFFIKKGFKEISKDVLPHKIWGECIRCVKFPNCDEHAVIIEIK
ncbi:MAG: N-acetyltransferase [Deltaproteobacteria bacterium]|nr:N-acetyltransferase [Deltaproteobacteria bacterium]